MPIFIPSVALPDGSRISAVPTVPVDQGGAYTPFPPELVTGGGLGGISPRVRVDVGQTGFFAGREFRVNIPFNLALGAVLVIKQVYPVNTIVWGVDLNLLSGDIRLENVNSGVEGGTFSTILQNIPRNAMTERPTPLYVAQNVLSTGGTYTGGNVTDTLLMKTADNSNFASTIGGGQEDERGAPPGTYFVQLTAVTAAVGVLKIRWEERA